MGIKLEHLHTGGLKIYRDSEDFSFGTDAVLLTWFACQKAARNVCDLCTGGGIIPLLVSEKMPRAAISGVEIDAARANLAQMSVHLNGLDDRVRILEGDLREIKRLFPDGQCDLVTVNPPYMTSDSGFYAAGQKKIARTELLCTFSDVAYAGKYLLRQGGRFCVIHRTQRLTDVLCDMRANLLEPKRVQFIVPVPGRAPELFLCEGKKCARPGLRIEPSAVIYDEKGEYTPLLKKIYGRGLYPGG